MWKTLRGCFSLICYFEMSLHILICIKNKYSYFFQIAQKGNFIQTKKFAMKIAQLKISFWYLLMK